MTITNPIGGLHHRSSPSIGPHLMLAGALAAVLAVGALFHQAMPRDHLFPAISGLLFALAAAVALIAWWRPLPREDMTYWDVAGGLTFIGICFAAAVEPEQMVRLVAGAQTKD